jgi:hypothetical protein
MLKTYLFSAFCFLSFLPALGQNKLDLRSPDKFKYFSVGTVIGGASYAYFHNIFTQSATRDKKAYIKVKSGLASVGTVFGLVLIKEAYDLHVSGYNLRADDYVLDLSTALLGSLNIAICIPLIF